MVHHAHFIFPVGNKGSTQAGNVNVLIDWRQLPKARVIAENTHVAMPTVSPDDQFPVFVAGACTAVMVI